MYIWKKNGDIYIDIRMLVIGTDFGNEKNSLFETKIFQILNINLEKKFKFYYLKELEIY